MSPADGDAARDSARDSAIADNLAIAEALDAAASLLTRQAAPAATVEPIAAAAATLRALGENGGSILAREGLAGLAARASLSPSLTRVVDELAMTGRWTALDRIRGETDAEALFQSLDGVGADLARRLYDHLQADGFEALEAAAADGRLGAVPGLGPRRREAVLRAARARLGRRSAHETAPLPEPPADLLLEIDALYRRRAAGGSLPRITPARRNPSRAAWLPILHWRRDPWFGMALNSNSPLAHRLGRTRDWTVLFFQKEDGPEAVRAVSTGARAPLAGRRMIWGREQECAAHYVRA